MLRAMWKGVIVVGDERVAVKLYSAVEDRNVHFRMLHATDRVPVQQRLVEPESDAVIEYAAAQRAYLTPERALVMLRQDELGQLEPQPSRDIEILKFVPAGAIDHRWYERPYFLGPDGPGAPLAALLEAMNAAGREGVARWVMRKKEYRGALRAAGGVPMLISLRSAEEVLVAADLLQGDARPLDEREVAMARQLLSLLEAPFEPEQYRDEYRERVLEMLSAKQGGRHVRRIKPPRRPRTEPDLAAALQASLEAERRRA